MSLDPRRAALWDAMGLGARWVARGSVAWADIPVIGTLPRRAAPMPAPAALAPALAPSSAAPAAAPIPAARPVPPAGRSAPRVMTPRPARVAPPPAAVAAPIVVDPERARRIAAMSWDELRIEVEHCRACGLCESRTQTVFAAGEPSARWMLVGEAPGADEDMRGEPFVGQAGKLLDTMLAAIDLARGPGVLITNVLKCRPPGNRNPLPEEVAACSPFLARQLELVNPAVVMVLGRFAAQSLLASDTSIAGLRGRLHSIEIADRKVPVVVSYHPAYLLRNLADKAKSWEDLLLAKRTAASAGSEHP
ncbi:MAG: uracil-DNA glycosylase [Burkholderiaceae bacterium]